MKNFTFSNYLSYCKIQKLKPSRYTSLQEFKKFIITVEEVVK